LPVLLAAGRFTRQKDFATLLDAFAILVKQKDCRLIILGEGKLRGELERHITRLGLEARVSLPGFAGNPYAYMSRCDMFVLSSLWEGSPNVLKEALALGLPVVATDCPSGPKEILQNGRFGPLVPMGDAQAMAAAMLATLNHPLPAAVLQEAVRDYTLEASTRGYLRAMQLPDTV
jgi:glycosyltransferase involved in cell wall biosynthesis